MLRFFIAVLFYIGASVSAVSAGLVSKFVDGPIVDKAKLAGDECVKAAIDTAQKAGKSAAGVGLAAEHAAIKNLSFAQNLGRNLRAAALTTGVSSAISGGKVGKKVLSGLGSAAVNTVSANLAHQIGERYAHGSGDMSWLTHKVCHFVLGGTAAEFTGRDFLAGGSGAAIGEMVADLMIQRALEQTRADVREQLEEFRSTYGELPPLQEAEALVQLTYLEYLEAELADQIERYGRLAAAGTAFIGRMDIPAADAAADLAIEYNSIASQIKVLKAWLGANYKMVIMDGIECFIPITATANLIHGKDVVSSLAEIGLCAIPFGKCGHKIFLAIEKVGKNFPRNAKKWAGHIFKFEDKALAAKYPKGVPFTKEGFPDFSQYATKTVSVPLGKSIKQDFKYANKAIGVDKTPTGYTWHHTEKPGILQLIPTDLHKNVPHTGGKAIERAGK